jgi:hypothetical protein
MASGPIPNPWGRFVIAAQAKRSVGNSTERDDGKRFVVRADEKLTAFVELESATRARRELS